VAAVKRLLPGRAPGTGYSSIPGNSLPGGSYLLMVGIVKAAGIPSASNDFVLAICGFDIIPFAVAGSSDLAAITVRLLRRFSFF
jgi:hypothetical protein